MIRQTDRDKKTYCRCRLVDIHKLACTPAFTTRPVRTRSPGELPGFKRCVCECYGADELISGKPSYSQCYI